MRCIVCLSDNIDLYVVLDRNLKPSFKLDIDNSIVLGEGKPFTLDVAVDIEGISLCSTFANFYQSGELLSSET